MGMVKQALGSIVYVLERTFIYIMDVGVFYLISFELWLQAAHVKELLLRLHRAEQAAAGAPVPAAQLRNEPRQLPIFTVREHLETSGMVEEISGGVTGVPKGWCLTGKGRRYVARMHED